MSFLSSTGVHINLGNRDIDGSLDSTSMTKTQFNAKRQKARMMEITTVLEECKN